MRDEYDFTNSQRGAIVKSNKERITIRLDPDIIEWFRARVSGGGNYQTLINEALREHMERQSGADFESTLRRVLREELTAANP
ncbi:CopG family transcriptional regulator [Halochromatium roseum]|nr:CopG family transcriptional regulator [Halochromatium roseum]